VRLEILAAELAVCRLDGDSPVPSWLAGELTAVVRRRGECALVCAADAVPAAGVEHAGPYRALLVAGRLDLDAVGILHALTGPLAEADIPILTVSTFDTDVLLVPAERLDDAVTALTDAGHELTAP
jgi:uncharacterized protein